jgi:SOS-response transcriptional repressor LexA
MVLTKKQQMVLDFIKQFLGEQGYSPSYREIMTGLDIKSVSTVAEHVDNLVAKGFLVKKDGSARSLEPAEPQSKNLTGSDPVIELFGKKIVELEKSLPESSADLAVVKRAAEILEINFF